MDTGNDYRILIAEDALKRLQDIFRSRKFQFHFKYGDFQTLLDKCHKFLQTIKYCYLEPDDILQMAEFKEVQSCSRQIEETIWYQVKKVNYKPKDAKDQLLLAEVNYIFAVLKGLDRRLKAPSDPAFALDTFAVQISNISKHPEAKKLFICRTTDGKRIWQIVTNITTVEKGQVLPAIQLPPRLFNNVLSEAMFVSSETIAQNPGDLIEPSGSLLNHIKGQIVGLFKK